MSCGGYQKCAATTRLPLLAFDELADEMPARRREHRLGAADRLEPSEDRALQRHVLGHGLDHEIGAGRLIETRRRLDPRERRDPLLFADEPMGDEHREAVANLRERGLEGSRRFAR